jgi:hypothetical protein
LINFIIGSFTDRKNFVQHPNPVSLEIGFFFEGNVVKIVGDFCGKISSYTLE